MTERYIRFLIYLGIVNRHRGKSLQNFNQIFGTTTSRKKMTFRHFIIVKEADWIKSGILQARKLRFVSKMPS